MPKDDEFAKGIDISEQARSVVSGKTLSQSDIKLDISGAPSAPYPKSVKPMLATLAADAFDDQDWVFEIKWDGYRAIGGWDGKQVELYSRNGKDFSHRYASVSEALRTFTKPLVLDGEIVVVDKEGRSHFEALQNYQRRPGVILKYYAFDLLWVDGRDLTDWPLIKRKAVLKDVLGQNETILFSDHIVERGKDFFARVADTGLEGMMAKKADSIYRQGFRSKLWLKVKTHLRQEVVIGGFTEPKGSRKFIGALIVGVYDGDKLTYVGHTGGGIPTDQLPHLRKRLDSLEQKSSPFSSRFKPNGNVHWVAPKLVCEVKFGEWTSDNHMRQPVFIGMRSDKDPKSVRRERPVANKPQTPTAKMEVNMNDRIKFTHLEKVFWPDKGYTKGDLINYYQQMAEVMMPYLKNRPCNLLRQPDGITGESFYQKDMGNLSLPSWARTVSVYSESNQKDISYYVIDSTDSLLYLVQLGSIEINPWSSRLENLDNPDWAVIDLDPDEVPFEQVVAVALEVKRVCDRLKVASYPKTSGKSGMHIFMPAGGKYSYEQIRQFSELVANMVYQSTAELTSLARNPAKRPKKIYLDYLQNRESQTLAAPYCVRPTKEASVSTPLRWSEVNKNLRPEDYTISNLPNRLKEFGDLWKPVLGQGFDLADALSRVQ